MNLEDLKVTVPEGQSGPWKVDVFTVSEEDEKLQRLRAIFSHSSSGRWVQRGTYTRLSRGGTGIMSDTPDEIGDHLYAIREAKGHILINGLGLGVVLQACLRKPGVTKATVIEFSEDVIALVAQHYKDMFGDRVEIINADAYEWAPPKNVRYGMVWHDIWDAITSDNLEGMSKLHRKYSRRSDWQGSWCRGLCEYHRSQEKKYASGW